jgi:hypothetical protein
VRWLIGKVRLSVSIYVCAEGVDLLPTTMLNDPILANPISAWTKNVCLSFCSCLYCFVLLFIFYFETTWDGLATGDLSLFNFDKKEKKKEWFGVVSCDALYV